MTVACLAMRLKLFFPGLRSRAAPPSHSVRADRRSLHAPVFQGLRSRAAPPSHSVRA